MHICYVSHTGAASEGGERCLLELVSYMRECANHAVTVLSPPGPLVHELEKIAGVGHFELPLLCMRRSRDPAELGRFARSYLSASYRMRAVLRELRPDVVHSNSATAALYAIAGAWGSGIPVIWHMRDIQPHHATFRLVLPRIGRRVDRVIAISESVAKNLRSFGVPPDKIRLIYDAVDRPPPGGGDEIRRSLGIAPSEQLLGVVGKLIRRKGQLTAIRALRQVRDQVPGVRLALFGGEGDLAYRRELEAEIERNGLGGAVVFGGYKPTGEVFDALDVLLVPSEEEPFGRVVAEAMFTEVPVVASRVGGIPEIACDGREAILCQPGNATEFARAVVRIAREPETRRLLVNRAAEHVNHNFSWENSGRKVDSLYRELVSPGGIGTG